MTKKLSDYEKLQNKTRRKVLLQVQKMLNDKSIPLKYNYESKLGQYGLVWEHNLAINWITSVRKPHNE